MIILAESKAQLLNEFFWISLWLSFILCFLPMEVFHLEDVLITNAEVKRHLKACDDSCPMGSDALPSFVMKHCSDTLSQAICILFNSIVSSCFWPSEGKLSLHTFTSQDHQVISQTID